MRPFQTTQIREALVHAAHRLDALGLVPAMGGNLSARISDQTILVTRTQVRKRHLSGEDLVEVDLSGAAEPNARTSTELGLHLALYRACPDVSAVIHAHPPAACGFAVVGRGLTQPLMPEAVVTLGVVPLVPYAMPGSPDLEAAVLSVAQDHHAFLLANHGAITTGVSVEQAMDRMEVLEHVAKVTALAGILGEPKTLHPDQLRDLRQFHTGGPQNGS